MVLTGDLGDSRSDEAILGAMALGDEAAGIAFVRRYQRRVYGMALRIVHDSALAEEVAQEALIRVWRHAAVYDERRGSVTSWVLTITRNLAVDALRLHRSVPLEPDDLIALGLPSTAPDPEASAERAATSQVVHEALRRLPPEQRRALLLAGYFGLTAAEIAGRESIPLGTAKTRIRTALIKIRAALASGEHGPVPAESMGRAEEQEWR